MPYSFLCRALLVAVVGCLALQAQVQNQRTNERQFIERSQELIQTSRLSEADRLLKEAIRSYPRSGGLYNLVGIVAAEQNRMADAEAAFLTAVRYSPALTAAVLNLARVYYGEAKNDKAIQTYQRALRLDSHLEEAHANLVPLLLGKGDYAGAVQQLSLLPGSVRSQNSFLGLGCAAFAGAGYLDRARQAAAQMTGAITEQDVSLPAFTLAKLHQNSLVIQILKPVANDLSSVDLRSVLATAYASEGESAKARAIFESLARERPKDSKPLTAAAQVAYRQKDYEGAAGYLLRAIESAPEDASIRFFFGIVCVNLNLPGDAIRALKEAVRLNPDNAVYNYALGAATLSGESPATAILYLKKYLQLRPADPHGHLALGVAEYEAGNLDDAKGELTPLMANSPASAGAHYILGKIGRKEGDLEAARKHFSQAIQLDPNNATLEANLATVYIRQNKFTEARKTLDRALELDSENYLANENLLLLLRKQKDSRAEQQAQRFAALTQKVSEDQALLLRHIEVAR